MAKKELFTSEDFDKEPKTSYKKYRKLILGILLGIAIIVAVIWKLKDHPSHSNLENPTTVSVTSDSITDSVKDSQIYKAPTFEGGVNIKSDLAQNELKDQTSSIKEAEHAFDIETEALKVIRGEYGNNPQRKAILGSKFSSIQNRVNEMKLQGKF